MQKSQIILLSIFCFASAILAKNCNCGSNCQHFKGKLVDDKCYYVAGMSPANGLQFLVSNLDEENLVIKNIFNGVTTSKNVKLGTQNSYVLQRFVSSCLASNCTKTIYQSKCQCKLNAFETFWSYVKDFYKNYNGIFWGIIAATAVIIALIILRCIVCYKN